MRGHRIGWTVDTLGIHVLSVIDERDRQYQQRFEAQQRAIGDALVAAEKAVAAALVAAERATSKAETASVSQQAALSEKIDELGKTLGDRIDSLNISRAGGEGKSVGTNTLIGYLVGASGYVTLAVWVLTHHK